MLNVVSGREAPTKADTAAEWVVLVGIAVVFLAIGVGLGWFLAGHV